MNIRDLARDLLIILEAYLGAITDAFSQYPMATQVINFLCEATIMDISHVYVHFDTTI
jgi:hypothetical protein